MNRKRKIEVKEWIFIILAWIVLFYFYFIISFWGLYDFLSENIIKEYIGSWYIHLEIISGTILFGIFFLMIDHFTDQTSIRRKSFGQIILIKSLLYIFMVTVVFTAVYGLFYFLRIGPFEHPENLIKIINIRMIITWIIFFIFSILFLTFIIQINKKIGPGNLLKLITGKYHKPRDEQRIFLFIDLKNSTSIAEKLGHNRYSQLLQNCYHDLTEYVINYKADIYQYVGDEVVLSWNEKQGLDSLNSIKLYYAYKNKLEKRKDYYLKKFDVLPEFKGGMDAGIVTVAEVGDLKREIAYHGDVLNTAARIQDKCREYGKDLLISENLAIKINNSNGFVKNYIGNVILKGKKKSVNIYSIELSK
jgi:adenylate cyclase